MITESTKIADIIDENYLILPVLNRFGIGLGLGDANVSEICRDKNLDKNFFLAIINAFNHEGFFPKKELLTFSTGLIIDYLRKTHQHYLTYVIPRIDMRLNKLVDACNEKCKNIRVIKSYYQKYRNDLLDHIKEEEELVFPYIISLQKAYDHGDETFAELGNVNIEGYEKEHHSADEKLIDLKSIMIKYLKPDYDTNDGNEFLYSIFQFEKDLSDHSRIEESILTPKVLELINHFQK